MHVIEIKNAELMDGISRRVKDLGIMNAAIVITDRRR